MHYSLRLQQRQTYKCNIRFFDTFLKDELAIPPTMSYCIKCSVVTKNRVIIISTIKYDTVEKQVACMQWYYTITITDSKFLIYSNSIPLLVLHYSWSIVFDPLFSFTVLPCLPYFSISSLTHPLVYLPSCPSNPSWKTKCFLPTRFKKINTASKRSLKRNEICKTVT